MIGRRSRARFRWTMQSPDSGASADAKFGGRGQVAVVLGLLAVVVGCLFWLPRLLVPPLSEATLQAKGVTDPRDRVELGHDRLRLENEARVTLFQGFGGAAILLGAFFTWRQLQENVRNNRKIDAREREAQITERFTRAIDQFGRKTLDVRLGGLYSLERIAHDSEADGDRSKADRDRLAIVEVLAAFVRRRAAELAAADQSPDGVDDHPSLQVRAPDLQAVLTVLGRLEVAGLDLEGVYLYKATCSVPVWNARSSTGPTSGRRTWRARICLALALPTPTCRMPTSTGRPWKTPIFTALRSSARRSARDACGERTWQAPKPQGPRWWRQTFAVLGLRTHTSMGRS